MPSWASRSVTLVMALSDSVITLGFLLMLTELIVVTVLPPPAVAIWDRRTRAPGPTCFCAHFIGGMDPSDPETSSMGHSGLS